jgi:ATP-binding cassette subfamily A (ABC1) protein 3
MMGMTSFNYYFSWFIHYFTLYLIINIAHTIILSNTFRQVDISLIFVNFLLFDLVLIFQSFLVQTLCTRAKIGIMFGLLFYAVQFLISFYYKSNTEKTYEMAFIVSLSPHGACILGLKEMVYAQSVEKSLDWSNLGDVVNYTTLNMVFGSLIVNLLVWAVLFLYLEQVFPN